jgi:type VI secretion system protein ImpC
MSISYDLRFGNGPGGRKRERTYGTRVLVIGDFLGDASPAEPRRPVKAAIGDLDGLVAKLRPSLVLDVAGARKLEFRSLDDFHPDQLVANVASLSELVGLRKRLSHPSTSVAAAAELRGAAAAVAKEAGPPAAGSSAGGSSAGGTGTAASLFEDLIGGSARERTEPAAEAPRVAVIDGLIRSVVAPYVSAGRDPDADDLVRVTDAVIAGGTRAILHHPRFQALEAAYRGLGFLVSRSEPDSVDYFVLPATRTELEGEAGAERDAFLSTALDAGGRGFSLVIVLTNFGEGDLRLLAALAAKVQQAGSMLLAGASPGLVGAPNAAGLRKLRTSDPPSAAWAAFRVESGAPHVGLALPRFLLRPPYGKRTDPVDAFAFEELDGVEDRQALLWGSGAFVAAFAMLVAQSSGESVAGLVIDDLPAVVTKKDGEAALVPCAEVFLDEKAVDVLVAAGLMPLVSDSNRAAIEFIRPQSIAVPSTPLALAGAGD